MQNDLGGGGDQKHEKCKDRGGDMALTVACKDHSDQGDDHK